MIILRPPWSGLAHSSHPSELPLDPTGSLVIFNWHYWWKIIVTLQLTLVRQRIRAYNEAVGTANTDSSGYHETITRLYLRGIATHILAHRDESLPRSLAHLLQSPLAHKEWPLSFYSRERLFSVAARRGWLEPDL